MSLHFGGAVKALAVGLSLPIRPLPTSDRQLGGHVTATSDSGDTGAVIRLEDKPPSRSKHVPKKNSFIGSKKLVTR
jgi:hypothetical protein